MHINVKNEIGPSLQPDDVGVLSNGIFLRGDTTQCKYNFFYRKINCYILNVKIFKIYR